MEVFGIWVYIVLLGLCLMDIIIQFGAAFDQFLPCFFLPILPKIKN